MKEKPKPSRFFLLSMLTTDGSSQEPTMSNKVEFTPPFLRINAFYNTNSKSARSLKYSPHSMALQFVERRNAIFFTTQQLSKLLLISKRSPKELDTIEMNNILKFQHNSWTINRDHIKFKFSFKLGWGFLWLMLESWSITPTEAHGKKAPTNNCKKYIGQNKSGRSGLCLATKPYIAILLLVLSSCGNDQALLELVL